MSRQSLGKQQREAGQAERALAAQRARDLVTVYVTNGVRTSADPGPGVRRLPPAEAAALVGRRHAVYGEQPPQGGHL